MPIERKVAEKHGVTPNAIPFDVQHSSTPLVLKRLVSDWPSVQAAAQGSEILLDYLEEFSVNKHVLAFRGSADSAGRIFYKEDLSGFNFDRITTTLEALFAKWRAPSEQECLYLGSTNVDGYLPGFRASNEIAIADANPLVSIWMGNRTRIAAHFDTPDNLACVVMGRRRFTLFPPDQLNNLYVGPIDFTPAGQAISLVDFADPDLERFPRFEQAMKAAMVAELEPGDALFIPSMWWHQVEALDTLNMLVNYWWNRSRSHVDNPMHALIYTLLAIKELPQEQRAAWQVLFEHYIFEGDSHKVDHIPVERRGVLGEMDESTVRGLRSMLIKKLQSQV
ncbi:MAG: cupin-like domain-containing protein [Pseudomonadota bacterium]